jgi:hypothetical protein
LPRRSEEAAALGYTVALPFELSVGESGLLLRVYLGEAPAGGGQQSVTLILNVKGAVAADTLRLVLNGHDLGAEPRFYQPRNGKRGIERVSGSYDGLLLTINLDSEAARSALHQGLNELHCCLAARPQGLAGSVSVEEVEISVCGAAPKL